MSKPSPRWAFMQDYRIPSAVDPSVTYLRRLRLVQTPWFALFLHWIYEPDSDRDPHDHPYAFASWVLRGYYTELRYPHIKQCLGDFRNYLHIWPRWSIHRVPRRDAHRILEIGPNTVTLLLTGRRQSGEWGFYTEHGYVPWREYK